MLVNGGYFAHILCTTVQVVGNVLGLLPVISRITVLRIVIGAASLTPHIQKCAWRPT